MNLNSWTTSVRSSILPQKYVNLGAFLKYVGLLEIASLISLGFGK